LREWAQPKFRYRENSDEKSRHEKKKKIGVYREVWFYSKKPKNRKKIHGCADKKIFWQLMLARRDNG
jgi:hypothetical protein